MNDNDFEHHANDASRCSHLVFSVPKNSDVILAMARRPVKEVINSNDNMSCRDAAETAAFLRLRITPMACLEISAMLLGPTQLLPKKNYSEKKNKKTKKRDKNINHFCGNTKQSIGAATTLSSSCRVHSKHSQLDFGIRGDVLSRCRLKSI